MEKNNKVLLGMSGGTDSSVAALLLQDAGYEVTGITFRFYEKDNDTTYLDDARELCEKLHIPHIIYDVRQLFQEQIISYFIKEYMEGHTPVPCTLCNNYLKWPLLAQVADEWGIYHFATGHYARVQRPEGVDGPTELLRGIDPGKDQSYFLHRLSQEQIARVLFPVGNMFKTDVRRIAEEISLPNAKKKDSTGICFIGERPFREFLNRDLPTQPGPIRTPDGKVVGEHVGLAFYTLGQRKGIGVGGQHDSTGEPWFVAKKDLKTNTLWICQGHDHPWLLSHELICVRPSWISGHAPEPNTPVTVRTRYRQPDEPTRLAAVGAQAFTLDCTDSPQWAATPGQSAVLYQGDVCLGGGFIDVVER